VNILNKDTHVNATPLADDPTNSLMDNGRKHVVKAQLFPHANKQQANALPNLRPNSKASATLAKKTTTQLLNSRLS
jgi:hypothetical protein